MSVGRLADVDQRHYMQVWGSVSDSGSLMNLPCAMYDFFHCFSRFLNFQLQLHRGFRVLLTLIGELTLFRFYLRSKSSQICVFILVRVITSIQGEVETLHLD